MLPNKRFEGSEISKDYVVSRPVNHIPGYLIFCEWIGKISHPLPNQCRSFISYRTVLRFKQNIYV